MKTPHFLKVVLAGLCTLLLPLAASAQTVVEIDQETLDGWIESGEPVTVPPDVFYQVTIDGETITLAPNTVFQVLDEEGGVRIVPVSERPDADDMDEEETGEEETDEEESGSAEDPEGQSSDSPAVTTPVNIPKPLPTEIVSENLNDISPS